MGKRTFDLVASLTGLIVLSPLLLIVAILLKLDSAGPIFYCGIRAGRYGRPFRIFKFRTMVANADKIGGPSTPADDPRVTRVGAFLRRFKVDELPQLINVIKGEMSLVGPRPEVLGEALLYSPEERRLLEVLPGITDWASIRFRNEGEILLGSPNPHRTYREKIRPEKIRLGLEYVSKQSFLVDCGILIRTLLALFQSDAHPPTQEGAAKERYSHE